MKTNLVTFAQVARRAQRSPGLVARTVAAAGLRPVEIVAGSRTVLAIRESDLDRVLALLVKTASVVATVNALAPAIPAVLDAVQ
jgi:hypothetical protein